MPLIHRPGEAQVDFGYAHVILDGEQIKLALFVMTLMYSDAVFCCVFPRECGETFLEGHRRAFEFFGGVPKRISYDNTKTAIKKIVGPRQRELTRDFLRLQSHYLFDCHFCLVRRPNEKGQVEGLVGFTRQALQFLTGVYIESGKLSQCHGTMVSGIWEMSVQLNGRFWFQ